jgi:hypothetical protein
MISSFPKRETAWEILYKENVIKTSMECKLEVTISSENAKMKEKKTKKLHGEIEDDFLPFLSHNTFWKRCEKTNGG